VIQACYGRKIDWLPCSGDGRLGSFLIKGPLIWGWFCRQRIAWVRPGTARLVQRCAFLSTIVIFCILYPPWLAGNQGLRHTAAGEAFPGIGCKSGGAALCVDKTSGYGFVSWGNHSVRFVDEAAGAGPFFSPYDERTRSPYDARTRFRVPQLSSPSWPQGRFLFSSDFWRVLNFRLAPEKKLAFCDRVLPETYFHVSFTGALPGDGLVGSFPPLFLGIAESQDARPGSKAGDTRGDGPPSWIEILLQALTHPLMSFLLLLIGFSAAFVELQTPGIGLPGFVAVLSFALFFWSNFLGGTAQALDIILFVLGIICVILEVAVIPGFTVFGIGGVVLIFIAVVLAQQAFIWPQDSETWAKALQSLGVVAGAFLVAVATIATVGGLLLEALGKGHLVLNPPEPSAPESENRLRSGVSAITVGQMGVTTTPLRLGGQARFGDQIIDVESIGPPVRANMPVRVVEIIGNRIRVEPVSEEPEEV